MSQTTSINENEKMQKLRKSEIEHTFQIPVDSKCARLALEHMLTHKEAADKTTIYPEDQLYFFVSIFSIYESFDEHNENYFKDPDSITEAIILIFADKFNTDGTNSALKEKKDVTSMHKQICFMAHMVILSMSKCFHDQNETVTWMNKRLKAWNQTTRSNVSVQTMLIQLHKIKNAFDLLPRLRSALFKCYFAHSDAAEKNLTAKLCKYACIQSIDFIWRFMEPEQISRAHLNELVMKEMQEFRQQFGTIQQLKSDKVKYSFYCGQPLSFRATNYPHLVYVATLAAMDPVKMRKYNIPMKNVTCANELDKALNDKITHMFKMRFFSSLEARDKAIADTSIISYDEITHEHYSHVTSEYLKSLGATEGEVIGILNMIFGDLDQELRK